MLEAIVIKFLTAKVILVYTCKYML